MDQAIETVLDAAEVAFQEQGGDLYQTSRRLLELSDMMRPVLAAAASRETLKAYLTNNLASNLAALPEIAQLFQALPAIASDAILKSIRQTAASHPTSVGPPVKATTPIKKQIVERILEHVRNGVRIGEAQNRTARQFHLGKRTVQAAWRARASLTTQQFHSMQDIWDFVTRRNL
jgi:hypothetical protein